MLTTKTRLGFLFALVSRWDFGSLHPPVSLVCLSCPSVRPSVRVPTVPEGVDDDDDDDAADDDDALSTLAGIKCLCVSPLLGTCSMLMDDAIIPWGSRDFFGCCEIFIEISCCEVWCCQTNCFQIPLPLPLFSLSEVSVFPLLSPRSALTAFVARPRFLGEPLACGCGWRNPARLCGAGCVVFCFSWCALLPLPFLHCDFVNFLTCF